MEDWDGELCGKCWGIHPNQDNTYSFLYRHEKSLLIKGIAGFVVIAALFTNCTHNAITRPQPTSPGTKTEETVACLSKYIRGDTVDKREIEEAYRKCPP